MKVGSRRFRGRVERVEIPRSPGVSERDLNLSIQMVGAFVRRQEYRNSDIRLDVGTLYRPDAFPRATVNPHRWLWHEAHAYPLRDPEHINILELRALIHTVESNGVCENQVQWGAVLAPL